MPHTYNEIQFTLDPDLNDIIIAELGELGYESFVETDSGFLAYIQQDMFDEAALLDLQTQYQDTVPLAYATQEIAPKNWNEEWERNYEPIEVAGRVRVRASYHAPNPSFEYDLVIDPKMSFGTGHHETTTLVMAQQLHLNHAGKSVLDVGAGTGILAILAEKLGATQLTAFDIEEWAYHNAVENCAVNDCRYIAVFQGTIANCPVGLYDIVLANINRNILLQEIPTYNQFLKTGGTLIVSGFYERDMTDITQKAAEVGLKVVTQQTLNQWATIRFEK
ncbi:MAG: 50S ribosomal protein L11 methyltransferase [Runella slithyformis]|nr:MAG: 50S ribosomal protein L11 methyltransferase [Runella slithyformis]TAF95367.1 MAG: 50S ribosomal protein L11 methyltransferase [Runella sp.]TAG23204.1 MAG: 50S ribosomal protein L11 methyltransferase [Cytophagales bacterium]TAG38053.1 MAG: 50S ribosomal protein L11 methyltransferase [Cytophagia bacterium]TAE90162.1 MAG: 50S ribosomal protein L11 methyltransferase [Runella slithyformis]